MLVAQGALLTSLADSILELSETYKCGSIVRGLSYRVYRMEQVMQQLGTAEPAAGRHFRRNIIIAIHEDACLYCRV